MVAEYYVGFADEQKTNKKSAQNVLVPKAPLCKGRIGLVPLERVYVTIVWLTDQYTTHLCVVGSISAMRVDFY